MSLISLTFGNKKTPFSRFESISITTPLDKIKINPLEENKVKVRKVCQFLGDSNLYLVCEVVAGAVCERMKANHCGNTLEIVEIDSKYPGAKAAKKGMTVGISVSGVSREDVKAGELVSFT